MKTINPIMLPSMKALAKVLPDKKTTMDEFVKVEPLVKMLQETPIPTTEISVTLNLLKQTTRCLQTGPIIYKVHPNLEQALIETDLLNTSVDFLRPPHESFMFELSDEIEIYVWNNQTGNHRLGYIFMLDDLHLNEETGQYCNALRVLFIGHPNENSTNPDDNGVFFGNFPYATESCTVKEWLQNEDAYMRNSVTRGLGFINDKDWDSLRLCMEFAAKLLLYVVSPQSDVTIQVAKSKIFAKKIERLRQGSKAQQKKAQWLLEQLYLLQTTDMYDKKLIGHTIIIDRAVEVQETQKDQGRTWTLQNRIKVRGHFKLQAYGKEYSQRKMLWIQPYYKGPDTVEVLTKKYQVK